MQGRVYDGQTVVHGQDSDSDPKILAITDCAKAVNRVFRGGKNLTRPPFIHSDFVFDDPADEPIVRYGNWQGVAPYHKTHAGRMDGLVAAIAGNVYFMVLVNQKWNVFRIMDGNNPYLLQTWFCQAANWMYVQNGLDKPIFWDGLLPSNARRSEWPASPEMPVGTLMAYLHGRVFVSDANDQIAASDIIYGNGFTTTDNTQNFTENLYWEEGGYFGMPTNLGHITGMTAKPKAGRTISGDGELAVMGEYGAQLIDVAQPRIMWKSTPIQAVAISGRGCLAPKTLIAVNNDLMFRSEDGISSFGVLQMEQDSTFAFGKISRKANAWFNDDTPYLIQHGSSVFFGNRYITTVSPQIVPASDLAYGSHRYSQGMIVMDLDQTTKETGGALINLDGLWTGPRPTELVRLRNKAFVCSYDPDGQNRIYEFGNGMGCDIANGNEVPIEWTLITKQFTWDQIGRMAIKRLLGGDVSWSEANRDLEIRVFHRPEAYRPWLHWLTKPIQVAKDMWTQPAFGHTALPSPDAQPVCGMQYPLDCGNRHQVMIEGNNPFKIDGVIVAASDKLEPEPVPDCNDQPEMVIDGYMENDYRYTIVKPS